MIFGTHAIFQKKIIFSKLGYIIIDELKISGKKKLDCKNLLNGYTFSENAKMR